MPETTTTPIAVVKPKTERPKLHKVILLNDDYTPREFVVRVLKGEFGMNEGTASRVMLTAHQRGACVVAVFTRDVAESKATRATDAGRAALETTRENRRTAVADALAEFTPQETATFAQLLTKFVAALPR